MDDQAVDAVAIPEERSYAGFFDLAVGLLIAISGAATTFALELCAVAFRGIALGFECLVDASSHHLWSKVTIGALFWLLWKVFWFSELLLLYMSVLMIELLAGISWLLCGLFAMDGKIGRAAHQRTRRLSHLTRWACRRPFVSHTVPDVHEIRHQEHGAIAVLPSATAIPESNSDTIQIATVVAIHDDCESNKGSV